MLYIFYSLFTENTIEQCSIFGAELCFFRICVIVNASESSNEGPATWWT